MYADDDMSAPYALMSAEKPETQEHSSCFEFPWSFSLYFDTRGAEYIHIYFWILKDLGWTQRYYR